MPISPRRGDRRGGAGGRAGGGADRGDARRTAGWGLDLILITHHHADHIDGVEALRGGPRRPGRGCRGGPSPAAGARRGAGGGRYHRAGQERGARLRGAGSHGRTHRLLFRRGEGRLHRRQPDGDGLRAARSKGRRDRCGPPSARSRPCRTKRWSIPGTSTPRPTSASRSRSIRRTRCCASAAAEIAAMRQMGGADGPGAAGTGAGDQPVPALPRMPGSRPGWASENLPDAQVFAEVRRRKDAF